jgi:putative endonuclease
MRGDWKQPAVYILCNRKNGCLYIGVTSKLSQRIYQHKTEFYKGFSSRCLVKRLVYYELHGGMLQAIRREKQLKKWRRSWKIQLIESKNPGWRDLWSEVLEG